MHEVVRTSESLSPSWKPEFQSITWQESLSGPSWELCTGKIYINCNYFTTVGYAVEQLLFDTTSLEAN